jgi:hypothetical protein
MRAARARRAALVVRLTGFEAFLAVVPAGFDAFVPAAAGLLVFCAGFPAAFFAVVAEPAGGAVAPPFAEPFVDCAETGRIAISQHTRTAMQRESSRGAGVGELMNLISSLYAAFGLLRPARTSAVNAMCRADTNQAARIEDVVFLPHLG